MYPHRIRLRGPWECEAPASGSVEPRRVNMPCRCTDLGVEPRYVLRRRFGYPGRIDAHERVWLIIESVAGTADMRLNEQHLGRCEQGSGEFETTPLLQERNVLELVLEPTRNGDDVWQEVALEIRCTAFLTNLGARQNHDGRLLVTGDVAGVAQRPLDLYLLIEGSNAGYQQIEAGAPFQFVAEAPPARPATVRVELVDAATVWYAAEILVCWDPPISALSTTD